MIRIIVENDDNSRCEIDAPTGMSLSLMEVLRINGYNIMATCGGIALCGTCRVQVLAGWEQLHPAGKEELDMLDMLPDSAHNSRLACQLRINPEMDRTVFRQQSAKD